MHYRLMYPSEYLNACDLLGKDVTVTIAKIDMEDVPGPDGKRQKKPVVHFEGKSKRWPMPKTCAKMIASRFGNDTDKWLGKKVVLYPTTCTAFGQTVECIRVRD